MLTVGMLFTCAWSLIALIFEYVNEIFPDPLINGGFGADLSQMRTSISILLIMFPVYLGMTLFLRKDVIAHPEKRDGGFRKFFMYLTLFIAALTLIIDLVTLVNSFLMGDLSTHFSLKVLTVLIVAGAVFAYYFWDMKRETLPHSKPSKVLAGITAFVVVGSIIAGFFIVGSPFTQRLRRMDSQRINDLVTINSQIVSYYVESGALPPDLDKVKDRFVMVVPVDPVTKSKYEYKATGKLSYEVCASFELPSKKGFDGYYYSMPYPAEDWSHDKGSKCFKKLVDRTMYKAPLPVMRNF